jgi:hypothetical protein
MTADLAWTSLGLLALLLFHVGAALLLGVGLGVGLVVLLDWLVADREPDP